MFMTPFLVTILLSSHFLYTTSSASSVQCQNRRPAPFKRRFASTAVDNQIEKVVNDLISKNQSTLACIFANCLPNTLDTTVLQYSTKPNGTTFIITGDINAMWLRDSMNQVLPYMDFLSSDSQLKLMIEGLILKQTELVLADPYANAHNIPDIAGPSPNVNDQTTYPGFGPSRSDAMVPGIFERKYELDSLCAFLKLSNEYYTVTKNLKLFQSAQWVQAVELVLKVMKDMQSSTAASFVQDGGPTYQFQRQAFAPTDTLLHGVGHPAASTGMVKSAFRPSDDATTLPFLIPANAMAVVELRKTATIIQALMHSCDGKGSSDCDGISSSSITFSKKMLNGLSDEMMLMAKTIDAGIQKFGIGVHPLTGMKQYAYEADGFGNMYYADDANVPSLLSLPYLGYVDATDSIYINTRNFVLSPNNPWYFSGKAGAGIGGPHVGINSIWPMSIIMQALTSSDSEEITNCVELLIDSTANTGLMHESFSKDNVGDYTRPWFAWANSLFGELVLKVYNSKNVKKLNRVMNGQ